jgi:hypothetical protein
MHVCPDKDLNGRQIANPAEGRPAALGQRSSLHQRAGRDHFDRPAELELIGMASGP